jgi:Amt family ammonium transporter
LGGVSFTAQLIGTAAGVLIASIGGIIVYGLLKAVMGLRLSREEEFDGADLTIHKITSTPDRESSW